MKQEIVFFNSDKNTSIYRKLFLFYQISGPELFDLFPDFENTTNTVAATDCRQRRFKGVSSWIKKLYIISDGDKVITLTE